MPKLNVYIVTYCQSPEDLWGNLLTFETLRIGFPTADVYVLDNGSLDSARIRIANACYKAGAKAFLPSPPGLIASHGHIIEEAVNKNGSTPCVFVDPDMIFYENIEGWKFNEETLMAGRLLPAFEDEYSNCITRARLHTSLLFLPKPDELVTLIGEARDSYWEWQPWQALMTIHQGRWQRWDTACQVFELLRADLRVECFEAERLDAYTHVFCGTNSSEFLEQVEPETRRMQEAIYDDARNRPVMLQGIWRNQEEYFKEREVFL